MKVDVFWKYNLFELFSTEVNDGRISNAHRLYHFILWLYYLLEIGFNIQKTSLEHMQTAKAQTSLYIWTIIFFVVPSYTVFDLITAHIPISAQSSNSIVFRLQPVYFFCLLLHKSICCEYSFELHRLVDAIQMSTHNICLYKENQKKNRIIIIK